VADTVSRTVRGVMYGLLGTALAQAAVAAVGFLIAGVPAVALLSVATFLFSLIPVGPPLIWGGATIWLFNQGSTGWAIFMLVWGMFVISGVDNVVKPMLISRGSSLPFILVLLGVMGGVLAFGFVGLFIGPTCWQSASACCATGPAPPRSSAVGRQLGIEVAFEDALERAILAHGADGLAEARRQRFIDVLARQDQAADHAILGRRPVHDAVAAGHLLLLEQRIPAELMAIIACTRPTLNRRSMAS
jgi:hypothetical protein